MKIGLLTLPFHYNYGGILQAYALKEALQGMGHEVILFRYDFRERWSYKLKTVILAVLYRFFNYDRGLRYGKDLLHICQHTLKFISLHFPFQTDLVCKKNDLCEICKKEQLDVIVVGSDQIWSKKNTSGFFSTYFLDFCDDNLQIKRIAYGASFGNSIWEYGWRDSSKLKKLAFKFDGISVRENDAVDMCRDYLGVKASFVLDPTLLLPDGYYDSLMIQDDVKGEEKMVCYVLDMTQRKQEYINRVAYSNNVDTWSVMPPCKPNRTEFDRNPDNCIFPSVESWLSNLKKARMVVTDSYHGCIFSIIFHRPFLVFENKERGQSRISSLLNVLGLDYCMIKNDYVEPIHDIDWDRVDAKIKEMRLASYDYLRKHLY